MYAHIVEEYVYLRVCIIDQVFEMIVVTFF